MEILKKYLEWREEQMMFQENLVVWKFKDG